MAGVQFQDALEAEQARYIHRSVPTAALGGLLIVVLVVIVFRPVVDPRYLYAWLGAFIVLTVARAPAWFKYRRSGLQPGNLTTLAPPCRRGLARLRACCGVSARCSCSRTGR